MQLNTLEWLAPPTMDVAKASSKSDTLKRNEIFLELIYYVFDSMVIPLIRSNFHVTDSNNHRNRLFYFRHDVWKALTEPEWRRLKLKMLEEIKTPAARQLLDSRPLGFSQIRLLPKANTFRPIINLRRRMSTLKNGRVTLGKSINSIMTPVFQILDFERTKSPELAGAALFSAGEMYPRIMNFKKMLRQRGLRNQTLHFVKLDAQSAFDTIPQAKVLNLMKGIISQRAYRIARHWEIRSRQEHFYRESTSEQAVNWKPTRRFRTTAKSVADFQDFDQRISSGPTPKRNTVFVDQVVEQHEEADAVFDLLDEHVQKNVIKVGKKFYRQMAGIPQGSVLSSLLCNLFYADLERTYYSFLSNEESLFLRLIDDFLLITTNKAHAVRFVEIMHRGIETHGVSVNPSKSLANFEVTIDGYRVPQHPAKMPFPFCGTTIDMVTLEIGKDRDRRKETGIEHRSIWYIQRY